MSRNQWLVTTFFVVRAIDFIDFITVKNQHNHTPKMRWKLRFIWRICVMGSWLLTASYGGYQMFLFAFPCTFDAYFNFIGLFYWLALSRIEPFLPTQPLVKLEQFPMQESWISWNIVLYYKTSPKHVQASLYHRGRQDKTNQSYCNILFWIQFMVYLYCLFRLEVIFLDHLCSKLLHDFHHLLTNLILQLISKSISFLQTPGLLKSSNLPDQEATLSNNKPHDQVHLLNNSDLECYPSNHTPTDLVCHCNTLPHNSNNITNQKDLECQCNSSPCKDLVCHPSNSQNQEHLPNRDQNQEDHCGIHLPQEVCHNSREPRHCTSSNRVLILPSNRLVPPPS